MTQKYLVALPITHRSTATLKPIFNDFCAVGSTGTTDEWSAYNFLPGDGYNHFVCCHKDGFVDPITGAHTNDVECCWKFWKQYVKRNSPIEKAFLSEHLNAWLFDFNMGRAGNTWPEIVNAKMSQFC